MQWIPCHITCAHLHRPSDNLFDCLDTDFHSVNCAVDESDYCTALHFVSCDNYKPEIGESKIAEFYVFYYVDSEGSLDLKKPVSMSLRRYIHPSAKKKFHLFE